MVIVSAIYLCPNLWYSGNFAIESDKKKKYEEKYFIKWNHLAGCHSFNIILCMGSDENSKAVSNQVPTAEIKLSGKVLVAYFTWPEPDGVDASSGASRIISDGKLYGNTEYVAS